MPFLLHFELFYFELAVKGSGTVLLPDSRKKYAHKVQVCQVEWPIVLFFACGLSFS